MLVLLFVCNFSWAAEHHPLKDKLVNAGFIHSDSDNTLSNVPTICSLIHNIINHQPQIAVLAESLTEITSTGNILFDLHFGFIQNISVESIAINAP